MIFIHSEFPMLLAMSARRSAMHVIRGVLEGHNPEVVLSANTRPAGPLLLPCKPAPMHRQRRHWQQHHVQAPQLVSKTSPACQLEGALHFAVTKEEPKPCMLPAAHLCCTGRDKHALGWGYCSIGRLGAPVRILGVEL